MIWKYFETISMPSHKYLKQILSLFISWLQIQAYFYSTSIKLKSFLELLQSKFRLTHYDSLPLEQQVWRHDAFTALVGVTLQFFELPLQLRYQIRVLLALSFKDFLVQLENWKMWGLKSLESMFIVKRPLKCMSLKPISLSRSSHLTSSHKIL